MTPISKVAARVLHRERARLDAEVNRRAGRFEPLSDDPALERIAEVLRLAARFPVTLRRWVPVRTLSRELREQIIRQAGSRGGVLDEVFSGVDLIEQSDAGRTFGAFFALVLNPDVAGALDQAVDAVLERGFADALSSQGAFLLQHLLTTLQSESTQVRAVMTGFSRAACVASSRPMNTVSIAASRVPLTMRRPSRCGPLSTSSRSHLCRRRSTPVRFPCRPSARGSCATPADTRTAEPVQSHPSGVLDLQALRLQVRESEIDFAELRAAIVDTLGHQPIATVSEVLDRHPATQGLASIVGLLVLAHSVGSPATGHETVHSSAPAARVLGVGRYLFTQVPSDWKETS